MTRRSLVKLGALAGAGSGLSRSLAASAGFAGVPAAANVDSAGPRRRESLDEGWRFAFGNLWEPARDFDFGSPSRLGTLSKSDKLLPVAEWGFDDSHWQAVSVPHDWAVELPVVHDLALSMHGSRPVARTYPETSVGWYRKRFAVAAGDLGRRVSLEFDGIFRAAQVFLNGYHLDHHESGYIPFRLDISDYVNYGGDNILTVRVDASQQEGWFYEGAGIYRHAWLVVTAPVHVAADGVWVRPELRSGAAEIKLGAEIRNTTGRPVRVAVRYRILDDKGMELAAATTDPAVVPAGAERFEVTASARLKAPRLWSLEDPYRYGVEAVLLVEGAAVDLVTSRFGVRSFAFDAEKGFFLNGVRVPIQGTCNHQDYAGVGTAVPDFVHPMRIARLKKLGSNAYRTHHAMTPELLEACDAQGMLVLAENRWESSTPEGLEQLAAMVRRDRNRACIFLWSLANEEPGQGTATGGRILAAMKQRVHALDPTRPVTAAMNGDFGKGFSDVVDVQGFNYQLDDIDAFRKLKPAQPCIGTEVASTLFTRGVYADDAKEGLVNAYGKYVPKWGETAEAWMKFYDARPWLSGGFVWTGYDYRGEPQPFLEVSIGSQFGILDTCGFAKDVAYYYQAWWRPEPLLHLLPHWNWTAGETIEVWCFGNLAEAELFLNDRSLGVKPIPRLGHAQWSVPFAPGVLEVRGVDAHGRAVRDRRETSSAAAALRLSSNRTRLRADGRDGCQVEVEVVDAAGRPCPGADPLVRFAGEGATVLGVGNGDPNSFEADRASERKAFHGRCAALVQAGRAAGPARVSVSAEGLRPATLVLELAPAG